MGLGDFSSSGSDPGVFSGVLFPNKFLSLQGNKSKSKLDLLGRENVLGGGESTLQTWNFHGAFIEEKQEREGGKKKEFPGSSL